ncbi:Hydrogenase expression protein HypE / NADH-quinone oxidoreductase subunit D (NuoD) [Methylacidimicrobium sp. AP8]|uniref:hydrogenase large subunit n=1 Tax=Methylacidimicrobium sp. AP8 TaxID=2730359 RepID=UPI0018C012EE|nr:NADH-quinone oxidoreductase subunit C [Methylacidimicrobium sp. AP8]CAB4242998.1 Hydrogenase expression protein HypE / NADH-quinone oxidoreductase subunit D (NuoD) [Methylacidimicrobium sp. AP8]
MPNSSPSGPSGSAPGSSPPAGRHPSLPELLRRGDLVERHRPWPRSIIDTSLWRIAGETLAAGNASLLGLWGEPGCVHLSFWDADSGEAGVLSLPCPEGRFPSLGRLHPPALRPERTIYDLFGLLPEESPDPRPWLDHGAWGVRFPLGKASPADGRADYPFLPAEGEELHQVPVGPVHAGIIEPGHFRFTAAGETVVRLEERLGYVHRGLDALLTGAELEQAARWAARVSGDTTAAYSAAFARAVEAALEFEAPAAAHWLRALCVEVERVANHLGDIGAICNDAAFARMHAFCTVLREKIVRAADLCFGHRLMMDRIVPGGMRAMPSGEALRRLREVCEEIAAALPGIQEVYETTPSLQDRTVGTGMLSRTLAVRYGCGGVIGRASGRLFDARRHLAYPPYPELRFSVPVREEGDVDARVGVRIREIEQSLGLIRQILDGLPPGPCFTPPPSEPTAPAEGTALVEGFRGDIFAWVRIDERGRVARCHLRDPSWFQWPLLEAAISGNIIADFPLCNKSFNCSYAGHDL